MNEFKQMLKEALIGDEPFRERESEASLRDTVRRYEKRMRTVRWMTWLPVSFMGALAGVSAFRFASAEEDDVRTLLVWAVVFLFAMTAIGWSKLWLMVMHNHIDARKELVRIQMLLLEERG